VPLLLQLRRTATAVQALAESAKEDLAQISRDVHQARLEMEKVAGLVERSLAFPSVASTLAASLVRSAGTLLDGRASVWMEALVTVLKMGMQYFKRPSAAEAGKENHDG